MFLFRTVIVPCLGLLTIFQTHQSVTVLYQDHHDSNKILAPADLLHDLDDLVTTTNLECSLKSLGPRRHLFDLFYEPEVLGNCTGNSDDLPN